MIRDVLLNQALPLILWPSFQKCSAQGMAAQVYDNQVEKGVVNTSGYMVFKYAGVTKS